MAHRMILGCMVAAALAGCGGGGGSTPDTGSGAVDMGTPATDTGTPATDTGTPATDTGGGGALSCADYCAAIVASCTGANRQYGLSDATQAVSCMTACTSFGWAEGTSGDMSGDTLACRTYHALAAAGSDANHALHCPHAGPLGGGVCGASACADFCAADQHVCPSAYASASDCMTACTGFSDATTVTSPTTGSGNTLSCRTYHLSAAAGPGGATSHCPHTAADGGGVCQ